MNGTAFTLILFSALMHALWNLLVKRSYDKTVFIWWMFLLSGVLLNLLLLVLPETFPPPTITLLLLAGSGAACFVYYLTVTGLVSRDVDLSRTYHLPQTAMLYLALCVVWLLSESLSSLGIVRNLLILIGAYLIQLRRRTSDEILRP